MGAAKRLPLGHCRAAWPKAVDLYLAGRRASGGFPSQRGDTLVCCEVRTQRKYLGSQQRPRWEIGVTRGRSPGFLFYGPPCSLTFVAKEFRNRASFSASDSTSVALFLEIKVDCLTMVLW